MLRIPHCLDSQLIDGGKIVSHTHRPHSTPPKLFFCFWYSFLGKKRNTYRLVAGKPEGRRPLGRPRHRGGVDNIKIDVLEIGWGGVDWIGLAQDRDIKCWKTIKWLHDWWPLG
jgi:hypothetical protein